MHALEDVKAMFAEGVLEVSVRLPSQPESKVRKVDIQQPAKAARPQPEEHDNESQGSADTREVVAV